MWRRELTERDENLYGCTGLWGVLIKYSSLGEDGSDWGHVAPDPRSEVNSLKTELWDSKLTRRLPQIIHINRGSATRSSAASEVDTSLL